MIPKPWAVKILSVLQVKYGSSFSKKYDGLCDQDWVVADWSATIGSGDEKLDGEAIKFAIENLPERPPNSIEFRNLCRQYRAIEYAKLPAPIDKSQAAAAAEAVESVKSANDGVDHLRWARNPLSYFAAKCVAELIQKRDGRFILIGHDIVAKKHQFAGPVAEALDKISTR